MIDSFAGPTPHIGMRGLLTLMLVVAIACSSNGSNTDGAAGSSGSGGTGGMAPPAGSCQAIRLCALDCADDACLTTNCLPRGTASAQTQFQMLNDCTKAAQPAGGGCATPNDVNCLCLAQCLEDPPCGDLALDCAGNMVDTICDNTCH
jgi:hypothetical protein